MLLYQTKKKIKILLIWRANKPLKSKIFTSKCNLRLKYFKINMMKSQERLLPRNLKLSTFKFRLLLPKQVLEQHRIMLQIYPSNLIVSILPRNLNCNRLPIWVELQDLMPQERKLVMTVIMQDLVLLKNVIRPKLWINSEVSLEIHAQSQVLSVTKEHLCVVVLPCL